MALLFVLAHHSQLRLTLTLVVKFHFELLGA